MNKIVIIGYGEMAKALAKGFKDFDIEVVGRDEKKLKDFSKEFNTSYALLDGYDITNKTIILAIKPYALKDIAKQIKGKPTVIIASTKMGAGIPEIENDYTWHGKAPNDADLERWM